MSAITRDVAWSMCLYTGHTREQQSPAKKQMNGSVREHIFYVFFRFKKHIFKVFFKWHVKKRKKPLVKILFLILPSEFATFSLSFFNNLLLSVLLLW